MSWLNGHTTIKALPSSDQEMLAAIMKLNKIKPANKSPQHTKKQWIDFIFTLPFLKSLHRTYKEREINKELMALEKIHLNQNIKDYHLVYLAAQKLFSVNRQAQKMAQRFRPEVNHHIQKKIELIRKLLIKQWRDLTTQRFGITDKNPQADVNHIDNSSTQQILTSLSKSTVKSTEPRLSRHTHKHLIEPSAARKNAFELTSKSTLTKANSPNSKIHVDKKIQYFYTTSVDKLINAMQMGIASDNMNAFIPASREEINKYDDSIQNEFNCGFAYHETTQRHSASYKAQPAISHFSFNKKHSYSKHVRFGFADHSKIREENKLRPKLIVSMFFKDEANFQQFKMRALEDPKLHHIMQTLEKNNQIRIGMNETSNVENQDSSERLLTIQSNFLQGL